jgi:ankyrin repeat protein/serine/threonine protein kinase
MQNDLLKAISKGESVQQIKDILVLDPTSVHQCLGRPTPLMSAAKYGRQDIIDLLISANSHVDDVDKLGKTALCIAVNHGHSNVVSSLISAGADVNHRDKQGTTPLMICSQSGRTKLIELLLMNGADRDAIRKSDSKKAIDLTSSTLVKSALLGSYRSVKYRAIYSEGDKQLLGNQQFEFPSRKDRCIRYVTVEQLPEGTRPDLLIHENQLNKNSYSGSASIDDEVPIQYLDQASTLDTSNSSNNSSGSNSSSSSSSSSSQPVHKKSCYQTHLVLKCSTDSDMTHREFNLLKRLHTIYGKDAPFIALSDGSWTPLIFRQIFDGDVNRVQDDNHGHSGGTLSVSNLKYSGGEVARIYTAASNLDIKPISSDCVQSERTWYGLLLERGVCDLNAFGVDVLSERNVRKNANCTEQMKKIARVEGSDGSVCQRKEGGQGQGPNQGQGQSCTIGNNDNNNQKCSAHISHQSTSNDDKREICAIDSKNKIKIRNKSSYSDYFQMEMKKFKVALSISIQVCRILSVLHDSGVVWLDVKPSNFVLFPRQILADAESAAESESVLNGALNNPSEVKSVKSNSKQRSLNQNKSKMFKNNYYSELLGEKYSPWGDGPSIVVKAIDLGACLPVGSLRAVSALTFSTKYSPPELARTLTTSHREKDSDPGPDSRFELFQVSPSADCWSLGITLMQIFHIDFRCYFTENEISDDHSICSSHQCPEVSNFHGYNSINVDGILTQDPESIASLKGSDAALLHLSVSPSVLQAEFDVLLEPISTHTTGMKTGNITNTTHTAETRHTADGTHTTHKYSADPADTANSTHITHTTHIYGANGTVNASASTSANTDVNCATDDSKSDVAVDDDDSRDSSVKPSIPLNCEDMKDEKVVPDKIMQGSHSEAMEAPGSAEGVWRDDKREKETKVEHEQRDSVIAVIRQLLRVTPSQRITAHTALHLLQSLEHSLPCATHP